MTTTPTLPSELDGRRQPRRTNWFAAFWRWHFYGSLIVIPVLFVLAVTGMTYMFRAEVDAWTHPGVLRVEVPPEATRRRWWSRRRWSARPIRMRRCSRSSSASGTGRRCSWSGTATGTTSMSMSIRTAAGSPVS